MQKCNMIATYAFKDDLVSHFVLDLTIINKFFDFQTDLAHHNPITTALKNLGNKISDKEKVIFFLLILITLFNFIVMIIGFQHISYLKSAVIWKAPKMLTLPQLEREYQGQILQMHTQFDEEVDSGEDQPVTIVGPANKKALGISSEGSGRVLSRFLWRSYPFPPAPK